MCQDDRLDTTVCWTHATTSCGERAQSRGRITDTWRCAAESWRRAAASSGFQICELDTTTGCFEWPYAQTTRDVRKVLSCSGQMTDVPMVFTAYRGMRERCRTYPIEPGTSSMSSQQGRARCAVSRRAGGRDSPGGITQRPLHALQLRAELFHARTASTLGTILRQCRVPGPLIMTRCTHRISARAFDAVPYSGRSLARTTAGGSMKGMGYSAGDRGEQNIEKKLPETALSILVVPRGYGKLRA